MRSLSHQPVKAGIVTRALARALPIVAVASGAIPVWAGQALALLPPGVTIVRDDPSGVTLEYAPPTPNFEPTADPSGGVRVTVVGHGPLGAPGEPDLPSGVVRAAVPATGVARLTIESATYASLGDMPIAPVPVEAARDTVTARDYKPSAAIYGGQ